MPSGSTSGPSGVAESPETAAGRRGQTADPGVGPETSGKAGAGPLGKAASAGTEATAAEAAVTSVTAVTSAPAAAVTTVTEVTSAVPGPKGLVAGPSGAAGSGTTPEDKRHVCLEQFMETIHLVIMNESLGKAASVETSAAGTEATAAVATVRDNPRRQQTLKSKRGAKGHYHYHLVVMNESLGKAAAAGTEATAAVAAVTAVTSAPAAAVTEATTVTSAMPGPKGLVARPSVVVVSGTTPEDNRPVKILLNLRRQFTAYKGNALNYCVTVKRIKFKLIRTKAWTLGSWLIERWNSLQACRTSQSCGRVRQVDYSVFRKIASWNWEAITVKVSRCSSCPILRWIHRRCRNRCDSVDRRRGRWTHRQGWWTHWRGRWTHRRCQDSVDHLSWLRNLTRSWTRSIVRFGSLETIRLVIMNSFKTRTIWLRFLERSVRVVVDEDVCVVVDNNVCGRVEVDEEQSGFPEKKIRLVLMNSFRTRTNWLRFLERSVRVVVDEDVCVVVDNNVCGRVEVDDEQSGFPEKKIRLVLMNSFRTRTNWFWIWFRLNRGEVVVDNNVVGGEMVDNERSGSPETTCWLMNSFKTRTFWFGSWFGFWLRLKSFKTRTFWFWSFRTFWLRLNRGEVVVADNVNAVIVVDDDQSGLPETIRLCENGPLASYGSNYCIQRKYNIE